MKPIPRYRIGPNGESVHMRDKPGRKYPDADRVIVDLCDHLNVDIDELRDTKRRSDAIIQARYIVTAIMRDRYGFAPTVVARETGTEYTTVAYRLTEGRRLYPKIGGAA